MHILGLSWLGTRTSNFEVARAFFAEVLNMTVGSEEEDFVVFELPDGSTLEVFGAASHWNRHLTSPVGGFRVSDLTSAQRELEAAGVEIVLPRTESDSGAWLHFRGPDGFLYELQEEYTK